MAERPGTTTSRRPRNIFTGNTTGFYGTTTSLLPLTSNKQNGKRCFCHCRSFKAQWWPQTKRCFESINIGLYRGPKVQALHIQEQGKWRMLLSKAWDIRWPVYMYQHELCSKRKILTPYIVKGRGWRAGLPSWWEAWSSIGTSDSSMFLHGAIFVCIGIQKYDFSYPVTDRRGYGKFPEHSFTRTKSSWVSNRGQWLPNDCNEYPWETISCFSAFHEGPSARGDHNAHQIFTCDISRSYLSIIYGLAHVLQPA